MLLLNAYQSNIPKSTAPNKIAATKDVEIVWAAGLRGLQANLGLAGSCPTPEFYAHEIPNEVGVGFGICFIPKIKSSHATLGILYKITLPGDGVIDPITKEHVRQVGGLTQCFNGRPCFGGYVPSQYEFLPGEWLFEFYQIDRKIIEFKFVIKSSEQSSI